MKKILLSLIIAGLSLSFASCNMDTGESAVNQDATSNTLLITSAYEEVTDNSAEESTEPTTEEIVSYAEMGQGYKLGDWNVTVNSFEFVDEISQDDFFKFVPDEGNKYLIINTTLLNNGTSSASFLETFSIGDNVSVKLMYKGEYEYSPNNLLAYDEGLIDLSIQPLATKTGNVVISVPETVINDFANTELIFTYNNDKILYKLS